MLDRRFLFGAMTAAAVFTAAPAAATAPVTYTQAAFEAAQKAGEPILVHITASWCPTCKAQRPILGRLEAEPKFKNLAVFDVDFDAQKDVVRGFKAQMQSTLIVFAGAKEVGRSVGDTEPKSIEALLDKSLAPQP